MFAVQFTTAKLSIRWPSSVVAEWKREFWERIDQRQYRLISDTDFSLWFREPIKEITNQGLGHIFTLAFTHSDSLRCTNSDSNERLAS